MRQFMTMILLVLVLGLPSQAEQLVVAKSTQSNIALTNLDRSPWVRVARACAAPSCCCYARKRKITRCLGRTACRNFGTCTGATSC